MMEMLHAIAQEINNDFRAQHIESPIVSLTTTGEVVLKNALPIVVGDIVKITGTYSDGFHKVEAVDGENITLDWEQPSRAMSLSGMFYLVDLPPEVERGLNRVVELRDNKTTTSSRQLRAMTVGRVREEYAINESKADTIAGVPLDEFDFIENYRRIRWGG